MWKGYLGKFTKGSLEIIMKKLPIQNWYGDILALSPGPDRVKWAFTFSYWCYFVDTAVVQSFEER